MAQIGQRVFAFDGSANFLSLQSEEYMRRLPMGNVWNRLRIGVLAAVGGTSGSIFAADFGIGICSYYPNQAGMMAYNTTNWVGHCWNLFGANDAFAYTAGANPYFTSNEVAVRMRVGNTITNGGVNTSAVAFAASTGTTLQRRTAWVLDVTKGSPYVLQAYGAGSAGLAVQDWNYNSLVELCQQTNNPGLIGTTSMVTGGYTGGGIAASEANGVFDAISIYWRNFIVPLEVYAVVVYRIF